MKKTAGFASRSYDRWPRPHEIEHYFLAPPGQRWFFDTEDDTARFDGDGFEGTEHLESKLGRRYVSLALMAASHFGRLASVVHMGWKGEL